MMLRRRAGPDTPPPVAGGNLAALAVQPVACYSVRKLIASATLCMRVQRSSDNAEQDIGFNGYGIDQAALLAFVGSASGYVTKFYDQTGNGFDAVTGGPSNSPLVVNAGSYLGRVQFDGSNDTLIVMAPTLGNPQLAFYTRIAQSASGLQIPWELSPNYNSNARSMIFYADSGTFAVGMNNASAGTQRRNDYSFSLAALSRFTILLDRSLADDEIQVFKNGALQARTGGTNVEQDGAFDQGHNLFIGGRAGNYYAALTLESFVIYGSDTAGIRTAIEDVIDPPPAPTAAVWDASAAGGGIAITNAARDAARTAAGWRSLYATLGRNSGKYAFEITIIDGASVGLPFAGIATKDSQAALQNTYLGNYDAPVPESVGFWGYTTVYYSLTGASGETGKATNAVGDVITVAVDTAANTVTFYVNGTLAYTRAIPSGRLWFPAASVQSGGAVRLATSGLAHLPAGFTAWDG